MIARTQASVPGGTGVMILGHHEAPLVVESGLAIGAAGLVTALRSLLRHRGRAG